MDSENNKKLTYEEKQAQREKKNKAKASEAKHKRTTKYLINWGITLIILTALGYGGYFLVKGELPPGEEGHLCLRYPWPSMFRTYWNKKNSMSLVSRMTGM